MRWEYGAALPADFAVLHGLFARGGEPARLPRAVLLAEVLGAPRALRPFGEDDQGRASHGDTEAQGWSRSPWLHVSG